MCYVLCVMCYVLCVVLCCVVLCCVKYLVVQWSNLVGKGFAPLGVAIDGWALSAQKINNPTSGNTDGISQSRLSRKGRFFLLFFSSGFKSISRIQGSVGHWKIFLMYQLSKEWRLSLLVEDIFLSIFIPLNSDLILQTHLKKKQISNTALSYFLFQVFSSELKHNQQQPREKGKQVNKKNQQKQEKTCSNNSFFLMNLFSLSRSSLFAKSFCSFPLSCFFVLLFSSSLLKTSFGFLIQEKRRWKKKKEIGQKTRNFLMLLRKEIKNLSKFFFKTKIKKLISTAKTTRFQNSFFFSLFFFILFSPFLFSFF